MDNELGKNDPFRGMQTGKDGVRPGFLGGAGGGDAPDGVRKNNVASGLSAAEESATGDGDIGSGEGLDGARQAENDTSGLYFGAGKPLVPNKGKGFFKGKFGKSGPIIGIFLALFGFGGVMFGTQTFQPFSLLAQFEETFNSMHTSANERTNRFFRYQMSTGRTKNPIKGGILFGKKFSISKKQAAELSKQGIEYDEDYNGKKVLKMAGPDGEELIITPDNFKEIYSSNSDFFQKYNAGSMTWRGKIANWFGTTTSNYLKNNKLTRNMFEKYKERVAEAEGDSLKATKEIISERTKMEGDLDMRVAKEGEDDEGNTKVDGEDEKVSTEKMRGDEYADAKMKTKGMLDDMSGKFANAANVGCAALNLVGAISLLVAANDAIQIINLTTGMFETVDKTKAGYGDNAPIHDFTNALNTRMYSTTHPIVGEGNGNVSDSGIEGMSSEDAVTTYKTAMEAAGVSALYSGGLVNPNDPSVQSFNMTSSIKRVLGGIGVSMKSYTGCLVARAGAAAVSLAVDGVEIVGCVAGLLGAAFTLGASATACGPLAASAIAKIGLGIGISVALNGIVSLVIPSVANLLMRDLVSDLGGEELGNALTLGANMYQGSAHRSNGGSPATIENYKIFAMAQQEVIAENARYERQTLSPFDLTSKNTFLGTIMTRMMSFAHSSSIVNIVSAGNSAVTTSIAALSPAASAYDVAESLPDNIEDYESTCPYLASIGAIGDSFCHPYVITDLNTIDKDPVEVLDKVADYGGFSGSADDENVTIDPDSDLAKYIRYCDNRSSMFGIADQNIANEVGGRGDVNTGSSTFNAGANGAIGAIPVIGDAIDIIQSTDQLDHIGYISGESCVAGNTNDASKSPDWNKAKYYQRFIEDQSLAESMGIINKSAVTAYLEDYYEKNPLDNSYEGILARYSGMTKDNVIALLDFIDYATFVANYDPSERFAFGSPVVEVDSEINYEHENVLNGDGVLFGAIVYADVRNRSFAV